MPVANKYVPICCVIIYAIVSIASICWVLWLPIRMKTAPQSMRHQPYIINWAKSRGWTPPTTNHFEFLDAPNENGAVGNLVQKNTKYECGSTCKCTTAGLKQYGRYCGFGYSGCPNTPPCDALDTCCMWHDRCVELRGYTDCECHRNMTACVSCAFESNPALSWCPYMKDASAIVAADFVYLLPKCFASSMPI
jgi:hypothetical protein